MYNNNFKIKQVQSAIKFVWFVTLDNIKYVKPKTIDFLIWMKKIYVIFTPYVLRFVTTYINTIGNDDLK